MKYTKRILALLLVSVMSLGTFFSCGDKEKDIEENESEEIAAPLLVANLSKYSIIVPEGGASDALAVELNDLIMLIDERFGVFLGMREDVIVEGTEYVEGQYEILVGDTNRNESVEVLNGVEKYNDYKVKICGDKLVIAGHNEEQLAAAVRSIIEAISALPENTEYFFGNDMQISFRGTYEIDKILIGDTSISEYTIVYNQSIAGKNLATELSDAIIEKTGCKLKMVSDTQASDEGKKILIGDTKFGVPDEADTYGYYVGSDANNVYIYGATIPNMYKATNYVTELIDAATGSTATLDLDLGFVVSDNTAITTMSFNLLIFDVTEERKQRVLKMIAKHDPDTVGFQEVSDWEGRNNSQDWLLILKANLSDEYDYVGVGRNSNSRGEGCQLFYKKAKFKLLDSGTKWLSPTGKPGTKYEGSACYILQTYALLERKSDGKIFMHINTHLDHLASEEVQLKQAKKITEFMRAYSYENLKLFTDIPVIMTGDFNCATDSLAGKHLLSYGMDDSSVIAFGNVKATGGIDWIITSKDDFTVYESFADASQIDGGAVSDHRPIICIYDFK